MSVIVIEFVTLDGVVTDPDGAEGTAHGGWAFRHGPDTVAGDKFHLGPTLDNGVLVLGRRTWEKFANIWPHRDDPFSGRMNAVPKLVASRATPELTAWANSAPINGDVLDVVKHQQRDVIIAGSLSIVHQLAAADLVDEYRLLIFPTTVGDGQHLFPVEAAPAYLENRSAELVGAALLAIYQRPTR